MAKQRIKKTPPVEEPDEVVGIEDDEDEDFESDEEADEDDDPDASLLTRVGYASQVLRRPHEEDETEDSVLYLTDGNQGPPAILSLTHPDLNQCQCEWLDTTVQTFGPKPIVRCGEIPTVIAFQKRAKGEEEPTGAMSLCPSHRVLMDHLYPSQVYYRLITSDHTIGDFA